MDMDVGGYMVVSGLADIWVSVDWGKCKKRGSDPGGEHWLVNQ